MSSSVAERPAIGRVAAHWQVLIAMGLAVALAAILPAWSAVAGVQIVTICKFVGDLFVNALKMLVVPLIASSLVAAVGQLADLNSFGRLFGKLFAYIVVSGLIAALIGLTLVNLIQPGQMDAAALVPAATAAPAAKAGIADVLSSIVPSNLLRAASQDQLLSVVFFSLLVGACATRLPAAENRALITLARAVFDVTIQIARLVLRFAPLGVFCLLLGTLLSYGLTAMAQLGLYVITVLVGLLVHAVVVLPLALMLIGRISPLRFFRAVLDALLTAFSTASSKAALPASFDALESRVGISKRITRFALPLSATMNMNGTALYECVAAMFVAQFYGIELGLATQLSIVLVALLTTLGNAGVPGGGVIGLTIVLSTANLPAEGIAMVLAVDRVLDMARTAVNVWADTCISALIASSEGESLFAHSEGEGDEVRLE
jgi:proton glutamate symport protein